MKNRQTGYWRVGLMAALGAGLAWGQQDLARRIDVTDHLNRAWQHELLTYRVAVPAPQQGGQMVPVLTGPGGQVPVQLCTEPDELAPAATAGQGELSFIVDELRALETLSYELSWREAPAASRVPPTLPDGELAGERFGLRFELGSATYDPPRPASDVAGPIAACRLPNGSWVGGSRLYGATPIAKREASVIQQGPVYTRVLVRYLYADGNELRITVQLAAGDYAAIVHARVAREAPGDGWELLLPPLIGDAKATAIVGQRQYAKAAELAAPADGGQLCFLSPWGGDVWFADSPAWIGLPLPTGQGSLLLTAVDTPLWVKPDPRPAWSHFNRWSYEMIPRMWSPWQRQRMPVVQRGEELVLQSPSTAGDRRFSLGLGADASGLLKRARCEEMSLYGPLPRLNEVKEMILAWPDGPDRHPYLYQDAAALTAALAGRKVTPKSTLDLAYFKEVLNKLGTVDLMRAVMDVAGRYDALVDSAELTPAERDLIKAQTAYVAYCTADPYHWSFERGQCSGNPNMTVSRLANLGVIASALRDHPMSRQWADHVTGWLTWWLENVTDDTGGWPESSHYARVSWSDYVQYGIVARRAGFADLFQHPRFQAMARFYEETLTPPDPLRRREKRPARVGAPYGRGTRGGAWGLSGLLAKALFETDPDQSKVMQWSWQESGYSPNVSHSVGGQEALYVDRTLPAAAPTDWGPRRYPSLGYLLRGQVGSPLEDYLLFVSEYYQCPDGQIWPSDTGAIAKWFAEGCPIGGSFRRIPETSVAPLINRVMPAVNWDPAAKTSLNFGFVTKPAPLGHAFLPGAQYADVLFDIHDIVPHDLKMPDDMPALPHREKAGAAPLVWRRQLLLALPAADGEPTALILRDTVAGHQPTQWHFWTLSDRLVAAGETVDRDALRADPARHQFAPASRLTGDRFTAIGQFTHDLETYVAEPASTPRYTLRYGTKGGAYAIDNFLEYQDCLHLQLEDDGAYYVAMVPRRPDQPAPEFARSADGRVLRIGHGTSTDWCMLSDDAGTSGTMEGGPTLTGTAAMVQQRGPATRLILAAAGQIRWQGWTVTAPGPVTVEIGESQVTATAHTEVRVEIAPPPAWEPAGDRVQKQDKAAVASLAAGQTATILRKGK